MVPGPAPAGTAGRLSSRRVHDGVDDRLVDDLNVLLVQRSGSGKSGASEGKDGENSGGLHNDGWDRLSGFSTGVEGKLAMVWILDGEPWVEQLYKALRNECGYPVGKKKNVVSKTDGSE